MEIVEIIEIKITNKEIGTPIVTEITTIVIIEVIVCAIIAMTIKRRFDFGFTDFRYRSHVNQLVEKVFKLFAIMTRNGKICSCFRSRRHEIFVRFFVALDRKEIEEINYFSVNYPNWTINKHFLHLISKLVS